MIGFNIPPRAGKELEYIAQAVGSGMICGDGPFTHRCSEWMERRFDARRVLLTTSGTTALDMAMVLAGIEPGDEVILPSFTFSSTATAPVMRGAVCVFTDIRPDTNNIDETKIEDAVTEKTKAIIVMHYAGVSCNMEAIMDIARRHNLLVIEDAAQGVMAKYHDKYLGTIGDFGCYSFHETKNYSMGEGGAIVINRPDAVERAEIIREKGTNRARFYRGQVDKYTWVDLGDSYLPSELNAAYLYAQLEKADEINDNRLASWKRYYEAFEDLKGRIDLPVIPEGCTHNAHMFYLKLRDLEDRTRFISYLKGKGVQAVFHYIPLHSSPAGLRFGRFHGEDVYTTKESERLVRLPMYYNMDPEDQQTVIAAVRGFFEENA
ncbi:MAG: dTDP-4-amino-4,6-dideoxygalactose transaminase [Solobacterium sp.]|nr:dTDP-4-amino-4,6-dideoxygalactose transaminase [Solobacterium sp.]